MKKYFISSCLIFLLVSSCTVSKRQINSQNYHVEFYKADFEYSQQVNGSATIVRILGIDWNRIFKTSEGGIDKGNNNSAFQSGVSAVYSDNFGGITPMVTANYVLNSLPIVGAVLKDKDEAYAVHNLLFNNPGYDVLIFPQFENVKKGFPLIYTKNQVKVTARLAKIKN